ncbi:DUF1015 domain-containing protein [Actinomadura darangshiensis]|uniref:DUF1015 domain-containing protein n=1 Tax=Actinomadura darangshiensis TaxID=705336 RepID=A0A4R4ZXC3_9ACTN|nr:DUF1015 domain-containing protein [Actinomadura darangshiensis]TDD63968.1 DUF1015 domain-containing protein [Actinomadura darangshiensis]
MPIVDDDLPSGLGPEEFSARIFGTAEPPTGGGLELSPFRGVRFVPEVAGDLASVTMPPYDLIDEAAALRLLAGGGHNIVRLNLPRAAGEGYDAAGRRLRRWLDEGALAPDPGPALYVYEAARGGTVLQRGLIGGLGLRAEADGVVLPHENVFPGPVRDRLALMTAANANLEPIFLVYEGGGDAARIVDGTAAEAPLMEFGADDGLTHRLWRITDPALHARVADDLRDKQALIADGHHRYATYRALQARHHAAGDGPGPWDAGLALLVDSTRYPPHLGAIHRVLPGLGPDDALGKARKVFRATEFPDEDAAVEALARADGPAFLLGGDSLHLLTEPDPAALRRAMPSGHSPRWRALDTAVLDHLLIRGVWDVPENENAIEVVHDDPSAAIARARRTGGTAVILNPLKVEDVLAVAGQGERVPRKSTSFGPKPRTGLVLRLLDPEARERP